MIIPECLFKEPVGTKVKKLYNPESSRQLAREIVTQDDKQLNEELGKKMINP